VVEKLIRVPALVVSRFSFHFFISIYIIVKFVCFEGEAYNQEFVHMKRHLTCVHIQIVVQFQFNLIYFHVHPGP